jgi:hypothetical protein
MRNATAEFMGWDALFSVVFWIRLEALMMYKQTVRVNEVRLDDMLVKCLIHLNVCSVPIATLAGLNCDTIIILVEVFDSSKCSQFAYAAIVDYSNVGISGCVGLIVHCRWVDMKLMACL